MSMTVYTLLGNGKWGMGPSHPSLALLRPWPAKHQGNAREGGEGPSGVKGVPSKSQAEGCTVPFFVHRASQSTQCITSASITSPR